MEFSNLSTNEIKGGNKNAENALVELQKHPELKNIICKPNMKNYLIVGLYYLILNEIWLQNDEDKKQSESENIKSNNSVFRVKIEFKTDADNDNDIIKIRNFISKISKYSNIIKNGNAFIKISNNLYSQTIVIGMANNLYLSMSIPAFYYYYNLKNEAKTFYIIPREDKDSILYNEQLIFSEGNIMKGLPQDLQSKNNLMSFISFIASKFSLASTNLSEFEKQIVYDFLMRHLIVNKFLGDTCESKEDITKFKKNIDIYTMMLIRFKIITFDTKWKVDNGVTFTDDISDGYEITNGVITGTLTNKSTHIVEYK